MLPSTAARAHDVATLRIRSEAVPGGLCPEPEEDQPSGAQGLQAKAAAHSTNYPPSMYEEGMQETRHASIADFIVALQRHGALESQRASR